AGVRPSAVQVLELLVVGVLVCVFGGSFGVLTLSNLKDQRTVGQIMPLIMFPQFFLSGAFVPVKVLPLPLEILSRISPMRYAVDFTRGTYYAGQREYSQVVLDSLGLNAAIMAGTFGVLLVTRPAL